MSVAEMNAKYAGWCRKCGGKINVGDKINWTKDTGASHVTCPEKSPAARPATPPEPTVFVSPVLPDTDDTIVKAWWSDGEYCSGWMVSAGSKSLEILGLGGYLSGWGWKLEDQAKKALGESFTIAQAKAHAIPKLEAAFNAKASAKAAKNADKAAKFEEARRTGQSVVISSWSEECDGSTEECDVDTVTKYALPDGTTRISRSHSW
jgi:hypothetical protein